MSKSKMEEGMAPAVVKALEESILTWDLRAAGYPIRPSANSCALCVHFDYLDRSAEACSECPVGQSTGKVACAGTHYADYCADNSPSTAQEEVEFLISLLPAEHPWHTITEWVYYKGWDKNQNKLELGVCPHCHGSSALYVSINKGQFRVVCSWTASGCGASGGWRESRAEAIATWLGTEKGGLKC